MKFRITDINKVRIKILFLIFLTTSLVLNVSRSIEYISFVLFALLLRILYMGLLREYMSWLKMVLIPTFFIMVFSFFAGGRFLYLNELYTSIFLGVRFITFSTILFYFIRTTGFADIGNALQFLPFNLGFVLMLSMSKVNILRDRFLQIHIAQKSRGYRKTWNVFAYYLPVLVPLVSDSLRRTEKVAIAMQARGSKF